MTLFAVLIPIIITHFHCRLFLFVLTFVLIYFIQHHQTIYNFITKNYSLIKSIFRQSFKFVYFFFSKLNDHWYSTHIVFYSNQRSSSQCSITTNRMERAKSIKDSSYERKFLLYLFSISFHSSSYSSAWTRCTPILLHANLAYIFLPSFVFYFQLLYFLEYEWKKKCTLQYPKIKRKNERIKENEKIKENERKIDLMLSYKKLKLGHIHPHKTNSSDIHTYSLNRTRNANLRNGNYQKRC